MFGILGGVIGVAMVAYQLWDAEQTKRVERSLTLVERFNSEHLSKATETLRRATLDLNEQLEAAAKQIAASETQAGFDKAMRRRIAVDLTSSANPQTVANQAALIQIARFFDETVLCVDSRLCNKQIICEYLEPYASEIDATYRAGLDAINERSGGHVGVGLASIIGSCKS